MISADQAKSLSLHFIEKKCEKEIKELHENILVRAKDGYVNTVFTIKIDEKFHQDGYNREIVLLRTKLNDELKAKLTLLIRYLEVQGFKEIKTQYLMSVSYEIKFSWG